MSQAESTVTVVMTVPATSRADDLLRGLDDEQRAAVIHESSMLAIMAPAGSGKTRTLTHRIAWQSTTERIAAPRVLAVTFTRKAAGELRHRLASLGCGQVTAGTFHALALAQLKRRSSDAGRTFPTLVDRKARILSPIIGGRGPSATVAINEVASEIEWAKARAIAPEQYALAAEASGRHLPRPASELAELYSRYELEKRKRRSIDFDDLLWWCADALATDADFAAAQRFRFRHLFVDEFQDVTPAQLNVLKGWLGPRRDLTVVGDDAQSIYAFAGAEASALMGFDRAFPGAAMVRLATNYRSTPQIVAVADSVLTSTSGVRRARPAAPRPDGVAPAVTAYNDEVAEARGVAAAARRVHEQGTPWSQIAILYRTNAQSAEFETALKAVGAPFRLRGATRFLERPEVRVVLDDLKGSSKRHPGRALNDLVNDITELANEVGNEQREHVEAVARLAKEYLAIDGGAGSVPAFLAWLESATKGGDDPTAASVIELSTFHAAKGLEWEVVFVAGIEFGLVPISYAKTDLARAEEQRLLHVALSRAGQQLHVSWAKHRQRQRKPSPWLELIENAAAGGRAADLRPPADSRSALATTRAMLRSKAPAASANPELFAALKQWRLNIARAHDIPAFTIFNDRTLNAIAAEQPATRAALLAVNGVGPAKLEHYGDQILALISQHCR